MLNIEHGMNSGDPADVSIRRSGKRADGFDSLLRVVEALRFELYAEASRGCIGIPTSVFTRYALNARDLCSDAPPLIPQFDLPICIQR